MQIKHPKKPLEKKKKIDLEFPYLRRANDDVVDRDENQLHEEPDESHHDETDGRTYRDLRELCDHKINHENR